MRPQGECICSQREIVLFRIWHNTPASYIPSKNVSLYPSPSITRAKADFRGEESRGRFWRTVCLLRALGDFSLVINFSQSELAGAQGAFLPAGD